MNPFKNNNQGQKKKLSLEEFKAKAGDTTLQESLEHITGGILGSCHTTSSGGSGSGGGSGNLCNNYTMPGGNTCTVYRW
jgi:hypothetical protein